MAIARLPALLSPEAYTLREDLIYILTVGTTNAAAGGVVSIDYRVRVDGTVWTKPCQVGDVYSVDGRLVKEVWLDPATLTLNLSAQVELDVGFILRQSNGAVGAPVTAGATMAFSPTIIAPATVETVETSMSPLPGQIVHYELAMGPKQGADTGVLVYVALKGATSGEYYAVCPANAIAGSFLVLSSETINLVVRNAGASAYQMSGQAEARVGATS